MTNGVNIDEILINFLQENSTKFSDFSILETN